MNQGEIIQKLIEANPKFDYTVTVDMTYVYNKLGHTNAFTREYHIHVHSCDDGAGIREHKYFNNVNAEVALAEALIHIQKKSC